MESIVGNTRDRQRNSQAITPVAISGGRWDNGGDSKRPHSASTHGMKLCPICATSYPASHRTCPTHGTVLVETPDLPPGTMIRDCYRIERVLGKGGMGTVYLAEHTLMNEPRALKFLSGALASNPLFVQRFVQEAKAATKLRHANIAQTLELGQAEDGSFYISMEFVDGPSLRALLEQSAGGMPPQRAFNIIHGVAEALGAAHAKRMVHRDIKPENILLAWTGDTETAKVVDFGIVAMSDSVGRLTQTGRPLLTAEYAAPEQWRGVIPPSELDGRTDLYALGCMFYEMLTGQLPFKSDSYEGWFEQHVHAEPAAPSSIRPELGRYPGLDALILKLLAKERENRPANTAEFLFDLDRMMTAPLQTLPVREDASRRKQTVLEVPYQAPYQSDPGVRKPVGNENANRTPENLIAPLNHGAGAMQTPGQFSNQLPNQPGATSPYVFSSAKRNMMTAAAVFVFILMLTAVTITLVQRYQRTHQEQSSVQPQPDVTPQPDSGSTPTPTPTPTVVTPDVPKPQPQVRIQPQPQPTFSDANATAKKAIALYSAKQYTEAQPLFVEACNGGHADSCDYLGWMYQHSLGVSQDYSRALTLYHKGCQIGSMAGCSNEGVMYQDHLGVAQDYSRAVALYTQSCNGNFATGCDNLGWMYQHKLGVDQNYPRAATLYDKACTGGNLEGCKNLGWMYQYKLGVELNYPRAASLYDKACSGGNLEGCNNLGYMYQHKQGVDLDYSRALALYKKACDGGEASACNNLGVMYEDKEGVPQDYARAAVLYKQACDGGNANGCSDLGDLYRTGNGVPKDTAKAKVLLTKGCDMGNKWGCDRLKEMQ